MLSATQVSCMVQIDIYSDTVCPWCFIGKRRLERALAARDDITATIKWHAFQLNPDMPLAGMERERYFAAKFGGPDRAAGVYATIARAGHAERIPFDFDAIPRMPNTIQSHRLVCFADRFGMQEAVVEALFQAFFFDGEDIGDDLTLLRVAHLVGLDRDATSAFLASDDERDTVLAEDLRARRMGINAVPYYVVNGAYAISGAQEPEAFFPLFDLAGVGLAAE
ncbi:MAG: DsbA family oxidoreductase [Rhodospirillaceae bacterium]|jgi:predicted DsbA family dithiol-disulfide isomerase|nr:DsbA family oxidoreductase [Rhodospirillaceae bacterium]MBT5944668.1 DsbA family oxidoreductase [Rhodospirillaceae bacterium]MBT6404113.1 DsbA family oxidoreductase [Rhodospirillaceae bacterium]MBT6536443.1 DsbA family oxidoreductase [Rhodospirillaceae bacterium]